MNTIDSVRWWLVVVVISIMGIGLVPVKGTSQDGTDKFRNAIQFEDNEFVGMYDVEVRHTLEVVEGATPSGFDRTELHYALTYGVFMNYEMMIDIPVKFHDNGPEDIGDVGLKQRVKFSDQESAPVDSSGGIEMLLPTGNDGSSPPTGTDDLNFRLFGSIGTEVAPDLEWLGHAGYTLYGGDVDDRLEYNTSLTYRTMDQLKLVAEANGWNGGQPDQSELYLSPGVILQPRSGFSMSFSIPVGVNSDAADHRTQFGLMFEF